MAPTHPPPPDSPLQKHLRRMMEALAEGHKHHARWMEQWERYEARERERWARASRRDWEAKAEQRARDWEEKAERQARDFEAWAEQRAGDVERWVQHQAHGVEQWARRNAPKVEKWADRVERKQRRKELRRERREARRERERVRKERLREAARANPFQGWVFAMAALVMLGMAVFSPHWWLIFVALGLGSSAAGILGRARERERAWLEASAPREALESGEGSRHEAPHEVPREAEDPRGARVDALCDKLLAELRAGPAILRDVVHQPEQTVEGLRKSCHELARRERELRALSPPEEERRLEEERARLSARVASEGDAVVKERLENALRLLDEQRRQRAELATSASRLEAEHMRLYYTLESLYTQVLRVRSADAANVDVAGAGLRQSVEQLGLEMEAVASAVEEVNSDGAGPSRSRVPTR
ncbi:hypothetical protein [Melittangium boletus]|uniref:Uncharacterized protein n=1 Tax=Melittangium boletus DSM 14713 TaxID=1294270 RepID=A0A250IFS1_9BACT|nr:hypothetical protein [Melittangium boletus]ATB30615.1 hypothetical protein MEBOL_004076 [Melittangium boletus DSM 14713]